MSNQQEIINTYTNHPAYQKPIIRSPAHNKIRSICGWLIICIFSIALLLSASACLYSCYKFFMLMPETINRLDILYGLHPIMLSAFMAFLSVRMMQWGRHLTRPTSREFV